jgi:pantothenate kinase
MPPSEGRTLIGIAGPPGCGKSTVAARRAAEIGSTAIVVPMDGFHLAQTELSRREIAHRKGAPETFDLDGFVNLLARMRNADGVIMAPAFDRTIEEPIAASIAVEPHHRTILIEGNYLLHDRDGWAAVRALLDECWYVDIDDDRRRSRLRDRHLAHGRSPAEADAWMASVDEPNAVLIAGTRSRADRYVAND